MPVTLLICTDDRPVPPSPGRWLRGECVVSSDIPYTTGGEADLAKFVQYTVTDQTAAQVAEVLEQWNREQASVVIVGPATQFTFNSVNINVSETIGEWTVPITVDLLADWNTGRPVGEQVATDSVTAVSWICSGPLTGPVALEFEAFVIDWGFNDLLKRTIWTFTEAGMLAIIGNGGIQSGTAAQLGGIVQDGRLD
jgi:hypothetical protein